MAELLQSDLTIAVFAGAAGLCAIVCAVVCCWRDFARRSLRVHEKEREMSLAAVQKAVPRNSPNDPISTTGRLLGYQAPVRRLDPFMQYKRLGNNPEPMYRLTTAAMPSASTDKLARAYGSLSGTVLLDDSQSTPSTSSRAPRAKRSGNSAAAAAAAAAADLEEGLRVNTATVEAPSRGGSAWSKRVDESRTSACDVARVAQAGSTSAALERELGVKPSPGGRSKPARSGRRDETRDGGAHGAAEAPARVIHGGQTTIQEQQVVGKPTAQGTVEVSVTPIPRPVANDAALAAKVSKTSAQLPKVATSAGVSKTANADIVPAQLAVGASESTLESQDGGSVTSTTSSSSSEDEGAEAKTPAERRPTLRGPTASAKASAALQSNVPKGSLIDAGDLLGQIELPSPLARRSAPNRRGSKCAKGDRQAKFDALHAEAMPEATLEARLDCKAFPNSRCGLPLPRPMEDGRARKGAASSRGSTPSRGRQVSAPLTGVGFVQLAQ